MRGWVEESCSFPPRESGRKMPEENTGMFAAPGLEFPEKYYANSALHLFTAYSPFSPLCRKWWFMGSLWNWCQGRGWRNKGPFLTIAIHQEHHCRFIGPATMFHISTPKLCPSNFSLPCSGLSQS